MRLIDADKLKQHFAWWHEGGEEADRQAEIFEQIIDVQPTVLPERLTDDDFETIRIHLNAYKEKLCNQRRWKEAEEYQRIIDRFMAFASTQTEIIRCKDCKYQEKEWREDKRFKDNGYWVYGCKVLGDVCGYWAWFGQDNEFCSDAERRTDGTDARSDIG